MSFKVLVLAVFVAIVECGPTPQFPLPIVAPVAPVAPIVPVGPVPAYDPYARHSYAYKVHDPVTGVVAEHVGESAVAPAKDVVVADPIGVIAAKPVVAAPIAPVYSHYYPSLYKSVYGAYPYGAHPYGAHPYAAHPYAAYPYSPLVKTAPLTYPYAHHPYASAYYKHATPYGLVHPGYPLVY